MNIVVLDGQYVQTSEKSWDWLKAYGHVDFFIDTPAHLTYERIKNADIVFTNKVYLSKEILESCVSLKYIQVCATGTNSVDVDAAQSLDILVKNVSDYSGPSVAQHVFSYMLHLNHRIDLHSNDVLNGGWTRENKWCYGLSDIVELKDKTIGIIGFGHIAQKVAAIAKAFEMNVFIYTRSPEKVLQMGFKYSSFDQVMSKSDYITLHIPLTKKTKHLINAESLALMKENAVLINTSRGDIVDLIALKEVLEDEKIRAAALDVIDIEPMPKGHHLFGTKNLILTPHQAWYSIESRERMQGILKKQLEDFIGTMVKKS